MLSKFSEKSDILIIYGKSSEQYLNLVCIENELQRRNIAFNVINGNIFSFNNIYLLSKAKVICVDQATTLLSNININYKTKIIQFWHACGAFKKVGHDAYRMYKNKNSERKRVLRIHGQYDYIVCSDKKLVELYARAFNIPSHKVLPIGIARTDLLYKTDPDKERREISKKYNLDINKKWVLYAPTMRESWPNNKRSIPDGNKLYSLIKENKDLILLIKTHPTVNPNIVQTQEWINVSSIKLESLIAAADVLITDFSSILFDFSFWKRPIIFYCEDSDYYLNHQRGIYSSLNSYFDYICNERNISKTINKALSSNKVWSRYMTACDGHATERSCDLILSLVQE